MSRTSPAGTPLGDAFHLYDTTLRDGAQREGITYSVADKLAVARTLDGLGVGFIEGGWPGAMPKDTEFFARAAAGELDLKHAALVAFGATRRAGAKVSEDVQVQGLLASQAPVITLVAKSDMRHVERALRTDLAENLTMVRETVSYLVDHGRRVFVDAEHFFDGYAHNPDASLKILDAAVAGGADVVVLCDTNGGQLPTGLAETVAEVIDRTGFRVGIHCQDDTACAVANSVAAVQAGATHVQCTANGYGERAGNADLFAVTGNLITKLSLPVLPEGKLVELTQVSHVLAELANIQPNTHQAYVGAAAFAHKAGLHASAIKVDPLLYNHIDPEVVGNDMRVLVTEMAGRASMELKAREFGIDLAVNQSALTSSVKRIKDLEASGWSFEAADASLELLLRKELNEDVEVPFALESYRIIMEHDSSGNALSEATVKLTVNARRVIATAEGNGPVNALDAALRTALTPHLPWLGEVELTDFKVRLLSESKGTDATTRVLIGSADAHRSWSTVGVHDNIVEASWLALCDALAYRALKEN
jgi:2-isopropylmalate synthase